MNQQSKSLSEVLRLREKIRTYNSSIATFDPLTLTANFSKLSEVQRELAKEDLGNQILKSSYYRATYLHERVHWLQHMGSGIGIFKQLNLHFEVLFIKQLIEGIKFKTPLADNLEEIISNKKSGIKFTDENGNEVSKSNKSLLDYLIACEYMDVLIDGTSTEDVSIMDPIYALFQVYFQMGVNLKKDDLISNHIFFKTGDGTYKAEYSANLVYDLLVSNLVRRHNFFVYANSEQNEAFSSFHIFEGQARMVEVEKIISVLSENEISEKEIDNLTKSYLAEYPYNVAYQIFERYFTALPDAYKRFFFLIICDYSINPIVPPMLNDARLYQQNINYLLPQRRFILLCVALKEIIRDFKFVDEKTIQEVATKKGFSLNYTDTVEGCNTFIKFIYDLIKKKTGFPTPLENAQSFLNLVEKRLKKINSFRIGNLAILFAHFERACQLRLENPLYFVDLGLFESIDREMYERYIGAFNYFALNQDGEYTSNYQPGAYKAMVKTQILLKFVLEIITKKKADLSEFIKFKDIDKEFIVKAVQENFKYDVRNLIQL